MALVKCKECGNKISDKAPSCIHCGVPAKKSGKSKNANPLGGIVLIGLIIWAAHSCLSESPKPTSRESHPSLNDTNPDGPEQSAPPAKKIKILNFTAPMYTVPHAVICPTSSLFTNRDISSDIRSAFAGIFGREEAQRKLGCEEWRGGIQVYPEKPKEDTPMIFLDQSTLFTMSPYLTNEPNVGNPSR